MDEGDGAAIRDLVGVAQKGIPLLLEGFLRFLIDAWGVVIPGMRTRIMPDQYRK